MPRMLPLVLLVKLVLMLLLIIMPFRLMLRIIMLVKLVLLGGSNAYSNDSRNVPSTYYGNYPGTAAGTEETRNSRLNWCVWGLWLYRC